MITNSMAFDAILHEDTGFLTPAFRLDLCNSHFGTHKWPSQPWPRMDVRELLVLLPFGPAWDRGSR